MSWWKWAGFQIFASKFSQISPKLNVPCDSDKLIRNELFVWIECSSTETIVNNVLIAKITIFFLDSDKARSEINNSQPSEWFEKRPYICCEGRNYTQELKPTENTNWAVFDEKLYFCKNAQTTLAHSFALISVHLSELNLNNFVSSWP